jgi:hypothetical protein
VTTRDQLNTKFQSFPWGINVNFDKFKRKAVPKPHRVNIDFDKCIFLKHIPSCFLVSLLNFQHIYVYNLLVETSTESVHSLSLPSFPLSLS